MAASSLMIASYSPLIARRKSDAAIAAAVLSKDNPSVQLSEGSATLSEGARENGVSIAHVDSCTIPHVQETPCIAKIWPAPNTAALKFNRALDL